MNDKTLPNPTPRPTIIITVDGGMVQSVESDMPGIFVQVRDMDNIRAGDPDLVDANYDEEYPYQLW